MCGEVRGKFMSYALFHWAFTVFNHNCVVKVSVRLMKYYNKRIKEGKKAIQWYLNSAFHLPLTEPDGECETREGGRSVCQRFLSECVFVCVFRLSATVVDYLISAGWFCSAVRLLSHRHILQRVCVSPCVCWARWKSERSQAARIHPDTYAPFMELLGRTRISCTFRDHLSTVWL